MLADTLRLAMWQQRGCYEDSRDNRAEGYRISPTHGLILLWHVPRDHGGTRFIAPLGPDALAETITEWLQTEEARSVPLTDWDRDCDHDGHNGDGWRVYCEDWGHVDHDPYSIVAIKRVHLWYGK